jgi:GrpB-like predicted nucleotidyltransferase (UPF0157 family)
MTHFLETKRLILKLVSLADRDQLMGLWLDPIAMKYIGNGLIQEKKDVEQFLNLAIPYQEKYGLGFCSVFEKETDDFIGQAGLFHQGFNDKNPDIEIAYRLHKKYWGKGYATELTKALIHWAFANLKINKIIAGASPENLASQKVLLKSGFIFLGKQKWWDGRELFNYEIYKNDAIELSSYNEEWPEIANKEIQKLYSILPKQHIIDIQHVGSTAIRNMTAKPVIDIQIAVDSLNAIKQTAIYHLEQEGYSYWAENPDPERLFFVKGMPPFAEKRTSHVHIVEPSSKHWHDKILFRDYLRLHPEEVLKYAQLKHELAKEHTYDREAYTNAKTNFVQDILTKAKDYFRSEKIEVMPYNEKWPKK